MSTNVLDDAARAAHGAVSTRFRRAFAATLLAGVSLCAILSFDAAQAQTTQQQAQPGQPGQPGTPNPKQKKQQQGQQPPAQGQKAHGAPQPGAKANMHKAPVAQGKSNAPMGGNNPIPLKKQAPAGSATTTTQPNAPVQGVPNLKRGQPNPKAVTKGGTGAPTTTTVPTTTTPPQGQGMSATPGGTPLTKGGRIIPGKRVPGSIQQPNVVQPTQPPAGTTPGGTTTTTAPIGTVPGVSPQLQQAVPGLRPAPIPGATPPPAGTTAPIGNVPGVSPQIQQAVPGLRPAPIPGAPAPVGQPVGTQPFVPKVTPIGGPTRIDQIKGGRVVKTDEQGRKIIQEPGNRTIIRQDNRVIVHKNESTTIQNFYPGAKSVARPGGITETSYVRGDGVRIVSEFDGSGRLIRRYGHHPHGHQINYVDNSKFYRNLAIGVGVAAVGIGIALALAPPAISMPRERYIVDYHRASDDDIYETLSAPPVMRLERAYSLEEIRYSAPLRDRMRRVDLDVVTFDTGESEVTPDQYSKLDRIARGILRAIEKNPSEMFLIEGHTDAVGDTEDNLSLSDRRAEAVSRVLIQYYNVPMENLVTQGYGEQHLKIETRGPERANRRVTVRRITPLLGQSND